MTSCITDEQIRQVFDIFDADGSGFIEVEELSFALQATGLGALSKDVVDHLVNTICSPGTVQINLSEFTKMVRQRTPLRNSTEESVRNFGLVLSATASGDGTVPESKHHVTVDDLMAVARRVGEVRDGDAASEARWRHVFTQATTASGTAKGIDLSTWIRMMQDSVSDKRHRINDTSSYSLKTRAKVAKRGPYGTRVEEGKTYYFCTCGMSKNQPFCDGSHHSANIANGTHFEPIAFTATETKTVWLCGCKQSNTLPFCDGTHATLPAE